MIRDGHQSLWAENMTTGMMLPIAKRIDDAGFEGIELISGSHLKKTVRELKEDPWERVRLVSKEITKTPLRVIAGTSQHFRIQPAFDVLAFHGAHVCQRHPRGAHLR